MVENMPNKIKQFLKALSSIFITRSIKSDDIYLTFDDGPHEKHTSLLLTVLKKHNVKASFFLVGDQIESFPHIVNEIKEHGHTIGYHSRSHKHASESGFIETLKDLDHAKHLEKKYKIQFNNLYRPPFGALTVPVLIAILIKRWRIILWSKDSQDSYIDSISVANEIASKNIKRGDIILLHDDYKETTNTISLVLDNYKKSGLKLGTL